MEQQKTCGTCGETKPLAGFYKQARGKFGVTGSCRACRGRASAPAFRAGGQERDEAEFVRLFVPRQFEIRRDGTVWQVARSRWNGTGERKLQLLMPPRKVTTPAGVPATSNGSTYISVRAGFFRRWFQVPAHRLVWVFFNGPIPAGLEINHKNGVRSDNRPENLEIVNRRGNALHARDEIGRRTFKLSQEAATRIRALAASGLLSRGEIAAMFEVRPNTISAVVHGRRWSPR